MTNVVNLHGTKRWRAVIVYDHVNGPTNVEHFLEEISELHDIIEHGPAWHSLVSCTITLNRPDGGGAQEGKEVERRNEHR